MTRCYNQNHKDYSRYGAVGLNICDAWYGKNGIGTFVDWAINNGYNDSLTIDRIDGTQGYSPENCRWVTTKQQNLNRSTNHLLEYNGEIKTIKEWADIAGIRKDTFRRRVVDDGWTMEEAMNTPNLKGKERLHHRNWRH